jgi:SHS2 domain-containing protein
MSHPAYEVLEHTADVGLKAYGATLPELFVNAARGMIALALEPQEVRPAQCRPLTARGEDREELIVHFLSEILYALDAEGWQFSEFRIRTLEATAIEAEGWGERAERSAHRRVAVKAVTYHQVSVTPTAEGWEAVVYFDI